MTDDIIERAEAALAGEIMPRCKLYPLMNELVAALKAARAENERLRNYSRRLRDGVQ